LKRILVVDDERQITRMLRAALQSSGYFVEVANNGLEAFQKFEAEPPDLIVTDLAMPEMNGLELTQAVRQVADTPIIVLSVRDTDTMKVTALDEGADDYLTKPFSIPELLARVRAQLRRTPSEPPDNRPVKEGDFMLDPAAHQATLRGEELHLTPKEFELLELLLKNAGRVMTHKVLLRSIWDRQETLNRNICASSWGNSARNSTAAPEHVTSRVSPGLAIDSSRAARPKSNNSRSLLILYEKTTDFLCPLPVE